MDIEKSISKCLDKIAKTKEDSLLYGGLFVGFSLGMAFFGVEDNLDLINILKVLIAFILGFSGMLLVLRGRRTVDEEDEI